MLDYTTISAFLNWLKTERNCSAATRNVRLAALSSFAAYAQNRNTDAALIFLAGTRKIPAKKTASAPRVFFTRDEVAVLLRLPDTSTSIGRRDATLLSLMYASGTRAQEVCDLRVRDALFEGGSTILTITGKGSKTRRVRIARLCAEMLRNYLAWREIGQQLDRHIFSSRTHEHMTISCVEAVYKKYLCEAKQHNPSMFRESRYSPHSMRHTCAMHMMEAGVPMMAIKNFLGHASVTTTERYAELSQSTVDKHIKEWNQRWFPDLTAIKENMDSNDRKDVIPDFLR
jgi:site-specific recombinase XerD